MVQQRIFWWKSGSCACDVFCLTTQRQSKVSNYKLNDSVLEVSLLSLERAVRISQSILYLYNESG
jgi:hypothetical protein